MSNIQCRQIGNRIEITPDLNLLTYKATIKFVRGLEDPKWHGFDDPKRQVWTVLDTPETLRKLRSRGYLVIPSPRGGEDMLANLEKLIESLILI